METRTPLSRLTGLAGNLMPGSVCLVGGGPGDSALISVRGAVRLTQADVVLHDKLVGPELLDLMRPDAERVFVGKWRGAHVWTQERINAELVARARAGKRVVRLKGGDPFVFGRGGEECEYLAAHGIPFEVVPGVTAAFGAPAAAGIPLTHRGLSRSFALVTGHSDQENEGELDFDALARMETIAIYMGVRNLEANCRRLINAGRSAATPVAVIEWGTRPAQRTVVANLGTIAARVAAADIQPPAMVLIGEVVRMRETIEWFERRPLHGQVVAVTRMPEQADDLTGSLASLGADVVEAPTIAIGPVEDYAAVDQALTNLADYAWLVVTSANGVAALFDRLLGLGLDSRALAGVKIAAVGPATAAGFERFNIRPDLIPDEAVGEALADALIGQGIAGRRVVLLRAEVARKVLTDALHEAGAVCEDLPIYRTVCPPQLPEAFLQRLDRREIGWITLTSPSTFNNLLTLLGPAQRDAIRDCRLASIGPVTSRAIRAEGFEVAVEADPHDVSGLVAGLVREVAGKK